MSATVDPPDVDAPQGGRHLARTVGHRRRHRAGRAGGAAGHPQEQRPARWPEAEVVGKAVPAVQGTTLDGTHYDVDDHLGQWVVVNFFGSWCAPCQAEQPELVKFAQEHQGESGRRDGRGHVPRTRRPTPWPSTAQPGPPGPSSTTTARPR